MEAYNESLSNYHRTLDFVSGTGARGQGYIDAAYEKLSQAHSALTAEEKKTVKLPACAKSYDDGYHGVGGAMASLNRRGW